MMLKHSRSASLGRLPAFVGCSALLLAALLAAGCVGPKIYTPDPPPIPAVDAPAPERPGAVLEDDTQVTAKTGFGRIKIEAGPGRLRVFNWNGLRRGVVLKPDDDEASDGDKGLYFIGKPPVWEPANGVTKVKIREGHHNFENADDALIWMQIRRPYFAYNNRGLAIGWRRNGDTLEAEVWQFSIDGKAPTSLPNADDDSIVVGPLVAEPQKMQPVIVTADGKSRPATPQEIAQGRAASKKTLFERIADSFSGDKGEDAATSTATATTATPNADNDAADKPAGDESGQPAGDASETADDTASDNTEQSDDTEAKPEDDGA